MWFIEWSKIILTNYYWIKNHLGLLTQIFPRLQSLFKSSSSSQCLPLLISCREVKCFFRIDPKRGILVFLSGFYDWTCTLMSLRCRFIRYFSCWWFTQNAVWPHCKPLWIPIRRVCLREFAWALTSFKSLWCWWCISSFRRRTHCVRICCCSFFGRRANSSYCQNPNFPHTVQCHFFRKGCAVCLPLIGPSAHWPAITEDLFSDFGSCSIKSFRILSCCLTTLKMPVNSLPTKTHWN